MFTEALVLHIEFFQFLNLSDKNEFQILYQDEAVPSNLLWQCVENYRI